MSLDGKLGSAMGVEIYRTGLCMSSVCAPNNLAREELEAEVNAINPTGIESPWRISGNSHFANPPNHPNPCPCDRDPSRLHYLMEC